MRSAIAIGVIGAALVAATSAAAPPVRGCAQRADSDSANPVDTPRREDLFVGRRLMLVGALGEKSWEYEEAKGRFWFKSLAVVRRGKRVTISVPRAYRDRLKLRYLGDRPAVTFAPCRDREWTYFPGGFVYTERACYAIDVRIHGKRAKRYRFPLGKGATCAT